MAYADEIRNERAKPAFFAVVKPRRRAGTWTLHSGSVWRQSFDYGEVIDVNVEGSYLTLGSSTTLSAGRFYYDVDTEFLYVRLSDSSDPNAKFITLTYELYFVTAGEAQYWHKVPTDTSTRVVYFDPVIAKENTVKESTSDTIFGYMPVQTSNLQLVNAEHIFEKHIYDSSFNKAEIDVYHWLGALQADNIKLVYDGFTGNVTYQNERLTMQTTDRRDIFSEDYRNTNKSFFDSSTFPNVDPNYLLQPIRYVYGVVDNFQPVNISFVSESPTTSDNRTWVCIGEQANLNEVTKNVAASPASTATRTYFNSSVAGFTVGDSAFFNRAVGTDEYKIVTLVNYASNYIEHSALSGGAMASGDQVSRSFVGNVTVVQNGVKYQPLFNRDYISQTGLAGGTAGFAFTNNFEANHPGMATLSPNDQVYVRVYGRKVDTTISASPFGTNDSQTANMTSPIVILYDLMKRLGLSEAELDTAAFQSLESTNTEAIGFAIPSSATSSFPSYKEIILKILATTLIRLFTDDDQKWSITRLEPITTFGKVVDDAELIENVNSYAFDYKEIVSEVIVKYASKEISDEIGFGQPTASQVIAESSTALYLHGVNKQKTFDSLHFREADAQALADHLSFVLGDRRGKFEFTGKNRFWDVLINDKIQVSRTKLPGFEFDRRELRTRNFAVSEVEKSLKGVQITMDDQKGIQDNEGSW